MPKKQKPETIKVGWELYTPLYMQVNFGLFEAHQNNTIMVDTKFWEKYVETRLAFEVMQKELFDLLDNKGRKK